MALLLPKAANRSSGFFNRGPISEITLPIGILTVTVVAFALGSRVLSSSKYLWKYSQYALRSIALSGCKSNRVFLLAQVTCRLDRKKPTPQHFDGFLNSGGEGVEHDHRLCESHDNGVESRLAA